MRFRTLALAALVACGLTTMAEAKAPKQKAVVHRTAQKGVVHRSANKGVMRKGPKVRTHKAPPIKTAKAVKHARKHAA